jgi:hypothetical protein
MPTRYRPFAEDRPGSVARTLRYPTWHPRILSLVYRHCLDARASTSGTARSINIEAQATSPTGLPHARAARQPIIAGLTGITPLTPPTAGR